MRGSLETLFESAGRTSQAPSTAAAATKCIRTMVGFAALGRLQETRAFPVRLNLKKVVAQPAVTRSDRAFLIENLEAARSNGVVELADAVQAALDAGELAARGR